MPDDGERPLPLRITKTGIAIAIRLTPGASADQIVGVETDADGAAFLKVRVRAVPEKGKANAALVALVAKWLGVAKSLIEVTAGGSSRLKLLEIRGAAAELADAFRRRLPSAGNGGG
jgi:uncharacterized protein